MNHDDRADKAYYEIIDYVDNNISDLVNKVLNISTKYDIDPLEINQMLSHRIEHTIGNMFMETANNKKGVKK